MSLIAKIRKENFKNIEGLKPQISEIATYLFDTVEKPTDCIEIDFNVFLPTKNKNLQRGDVWTLSQKQELIKSIILGRNINMPTIIMIRNNDGSRKIEVIDGKQRITAIIEFMQNKFEVDGYTHKDFGFEFKNNLDLKANVYNAYQDRPITDQQKIELFKLLNFSGTPQDENHLNNL